VIKQLGGAAERGKGKKKQGCVRRVEREVGSRDRKRKSKIKLQE